MESRRQSALVKQLQRQIAHQRRREEKNMYTNLRHRMERRDFLDRHFLELEKEIIQSFDARYESIKNAIELNKLRFELDLQYKIDEICSGPSLSSVAPPTVAVQENTRYNDYLFFKNLYPTAASNYDNDFFYASVALVLFAYAFIERFTC